MTVPPGPEQRAAGPYRGGGRAGVAGVTPGTVTPGPDGSVVPV